MKKPTKQQIEKAKQTLKNAGYLSPMWHKDDIRERYLENYGSKVIPLNDEEVNQIAGAIERRHDANIGINWDVIDIFIDQHLNP